jgi:rubrerythrin
MIFGAHLDNDDFFAQIEEELKKYKCQTCGYITNKPRKPLDGETF